MRKTLRLEFCKVAIAIRCCKGKPFEGGHRVPFIARWPGTGPGLDIVQLEFDWAEVR